MVSDVIYEALETIKEYEEKMPQIYVENKKIAEIIANLKVHMEDVQMFLDVYNPKIQGYPKVGKYEKK